jgi:hypothetical protein
MRIGCGERLVLFFVEASLGVVVRVAVAVVVVVVRVVVVMVVVVVVVRVAFTRRRGTHSTAGLAVVAATVLPGAELGEVVREHEAQLGGERCVVGLPVGDRRCEAGPWPWVRIRSGHAPSLSSR